MKPIGWYIKRISNMSFPEIGYRIGQNFFEKIDQIRYGNRTLKFPESIRLDREKLFSLMQHITIDNLTHWTESADFSFIETADQYFSNQINIFGIHHNFGESVDWHLDSKTGKYWPIKFWTDINIRDGFTIGGPKFVWEVNRLYGLPILGIAYMLSGDRRYAEKIFDLLDGWMTENPYPMGVNWTSGIELSIRIANLIWSISFLRAYNMSEKQHELINRFAWLHGRHLYRYPSRYSSNNNHAIAEAFALFLIGFYFPAFDEAKKWFFFGRNVLDREAARQILVDGGSYEYTTSYLSFVFDFFLLYKLVCEKNKIAYDPVVNNRLEKSCQYIHSLMDLAGNIANIGDQDSAVLVNFGLDNHENFTSILNSGAVIFDTPELAKDFFPDIKTKFLLGEEAFKIKAGTQKSKNEARILKESGLSLIRDNTKTKELLFVGNATPLGMPPLYAHGHLDAASFWLSINGKEIFVDPGTYLYHSGGKWRRYFRSTTAHNTVRLDNQDFTEQTGDFMFGKPYHITLHELQEKDDRVVWRVGHDAYEKLKPPVKFTREVEFSKGSGHFLFMDTMKTFGNHLCEIYFHLHPECIAVIEQNRIWITRSEVKLCMEIDQRLSIQSYRGSEDPLLGWFSKRFNHITETTTIVCFGRFSGSVAYINKLELQK